jgi:23S rRNA pseudouridine1911/1915/1917 synthase
MSENPIYNLIASETDSGKRLDSFVVEKLPDISRSQVKRLIDDGFILVGDKKSKAAYRVDVDDEIVVNIPPLKESSAIAQDIPLDVIFEDSDIIVVNKSPGMVVHPAAGHPDGTLVNALLAHCDDLSGIGGELKAGIVHRLDVGTSGVIVAAKNDVAHKSLADQFKDRTIKKIYGALIIGLMPSETGELDSPIGRSKGDRKKMSAHTGKSRDALTQWRVLEEFGTFVSWVEIRLRTGRTHQIRVHFAEAGHPLVGDPLYGGEKKAKRLPSGEFRNAAAGFKRPALHAWKIGFDHPRSGERMEFEAPIPQDIEGLLKVFRGADV